MEDHPPLAATFLDATSVLVSLIGFLCWVFVVLAWPPLHHAAVDHPAGQQAATAAYSSVQPAHLRCGSTRPG
jgi:hypothetical protein